MSNSFTFGAINTNVKKKYQNNQVSSILIHSKHEESNNGHILFLLESPLAKSYLYSLKIWLDANSRGFNYDVVLASPVNIPPEAIKKNGVYMFYKQNQSSWKEYVQKNKTIVVTIGYSIYATTLSSDLNIQSFYDFIFNKTYFYAPRTGTYVFPIDGIEKLFKTESTGVVPSKSSYVKFAELQLNTLRNRYEELKIPPTPIRPKIIKLNSKEEVDSFYEKYSSPQKVAWDIETSSLNFNRGRPGCITFSFDGKTGYYIPWKFIDVDKLSQFFENKYQIGQNLKFDCKFLRKFGVKNIQANSDTMHLSHTINEMRLHGLKSLAYYYTQYGGYDYELDDYISRFKPSNYLEIPESLLSKYATMDAIVNYIVHEKMQEQLDTIDKNYPPPKEGWWTLREYYEKIKVPLANKFIDIELRGFPVDMKKWDTGSAIIAEKILELKTRLFDSLKVKEALSKSSYSLSSLYTDMDSMFDSFDDEEDTSDLNSSKKLGEVLEFLGWEDLGRTKAGTYLTGDEQLQRWIQLGHEEAEYISKLRSYSTLMKTFLGNVGTDEGWRAYIDEHDGQSFIHPSYRSMMTESGRISCGDPNFQQVPSKSLGADLFKKIISVPNPENQYLVTLDYSSLQMRLAAIDSEDPVLYGSYIKNPNIDMHSKTGYNIFCKGKEFDIEEYIINGKTYLSTQSLKVKNIENGQEENVPLPMIYSTPEKYELLLV